VLQKFSIEIPNSIASAHKVSSQCCDIIKEQEKNNVVFLTIAGNLFSSLHHMEEYDVDTIYVEAVSETGIGIAIMDRLNKAAYRFSGIKTNENEKVL
jgi:phosphoribosylcarboxyaminoimidazole (NCAIR) mutase